MSEKPDDRKARLAQALRDNLRRRKGQAREGAAGQDQSGAVADSSQDDSAPSS